MHFLKHYCSYYNYKIHLFTDLFFETEKKRFTMDLYENMKVNGGFNNGFLGTQCLGKAASVLLLSPGK